MLQVCLIVSLMFAAEPSPKLKKLMEDGAKTHQAEVAKLADSLKRMGKGVVRKGAGNSSKDGKFVFNSKEAKASAIEAAEKKLKDLESQKFIGPELSLATLKIGDVGRLRDGIWKSEVVAKVVHVAPMECVVIQSTNDDRMLAVKMDTTGITTNSYIPLNRDYEVIGTKSFRLTNGSLQTVFEVAPFVWPKD